MTLNQSLTQIITSITQLIGILVMMFSINLTMTLVALCVVPVSALFILLVVRHSQPYFKRQQDYLGHVNGHIEEMYGSHVVVKAFNGEEKSERAFRHFNDNLYTAGWKSQFFSGLMQPVMTFIGNAGFVAICILGGWFAIQGVISVGDIQAFTQYVRQFTMPIQQVANISNVLQAAAAAAERVFAFLAEKRGSPRKRAPDYRQYGQGARHGITRPHSGFRPVRPCEIRVHAGKDDHPRLLRADCPGPEGRHRRPDGRRQDDDCQLLMRFYDVTEGAILVDGYDIRDFKRSDLRSLFGMVLQDTWLYNASIADNIRYGRQDATDEEVRAAARSAQVDHFVRTLPGGYDMVLNEEASNVSQGPKTASDHRARDFADPQILILDEATSSVDTRTEILIQKAMDNLMRGRTSFIIAHRLSRSATPT